MNKPIAYWMSKEEMWTYYKESNQEERVKIRSAMNRLADCIEGVENDAALRLKKFRRFEENVQTNIE